MVVLYWKVDFFSNSLVLCLNLYFRPQSPLVSGSINICRPARRDPWINLDHYVGFFRDFNCSVRKHAKITSTLTLKTLTVFFNYKILLFEFVFNQTLVLISLFNWKNLFKRLNNEFVSLQWKRLIKIALDSDKFNSRQHQPFGSRKMKDENNIIC